MKLISDFFALIICSVLLVFALVFMLVDWLIGAIKSPD